MSVVLNMLRLDGLTRRRELAILIGLGTLKVLSWTLIKPLLPLFAASLGACSMLIGTIVAVPPLIQILTRMPSGRAAAVSGNRKLIFVSFVVTMLGAFSLTISRSVAVIFLAQICMALGESLFWPAHWSYVTSLAPTPRQGAVVGLVMAFHGVAGIFVPYVAGRIYDLYGFWLNGLVYTGAAVIGLSLATRLPALAGAAAAARRRSPAANGRGLLAREMVLLAAWSALIIFFSWGVNSTFYSVYVRSLGFTATTVGMLLAWEGVFSTVSRLAFISLSSRLPVDRLLLAAIFTNAFPLMLLPWVRTLPLLMLVATITGAARGAVPAAIKALFANATSEAERPLVMGIDGVAMNVGSLTSPLLAGAVAGWVGVPATFFVGNLLALAALALSRPVSRGRGVVNLLSGREPEPAAVAGPTLPAP